MKTQIWIAVSVYVLVAIMRKRLGIESSLYQVLQILSRTGVDRLVTADVLRLNSC